MKNEQMSEEKYFELLNIITSGCLFRYYSYNHKEALKEYHSDDKYSIVRIHIPHPNCFFMPDELKEKYKVEKIGKLREIRFAPNGRACHFKIGAKYSKTFFLDDFYKNVFPIL